MEHKAYIIIDDNDQKARMEQKINNVLRPDGYKIESFYYDPNDREFWDADQEMDLSKFTSKIIQETQTYHINVIACDYQYSGNKYNGVNIIHELRKSGFLSPIILYSSNETKVATELFNGALSNEEKILRFIILLKCRIDQFLVRETYYEVVLEMLKKNYNLKAIVLKKLSEYPDLIIKFDSGFFEGKKFSDVIDEINRNSLHGNSFMAEILELAIANFAQINSNE